MKKHFPILIAAIVTMSLIFFCYSVEAQPKVKPLHSGWYSHKQLVKRGYECAPFKGRVCMTYALYQKLITDKKVK